MKYGILGPLEARDEHGEIALGGTKQRAVLAMLLLHANEPVSKDHLVMGLWGEEAPADRVSTVHVHVSRLRKALGHAALLETTPGGAYRLRVEPGDLDADCFVRRVDEARRARELDRFDRAAALFREALGLWRGPALADLAFEPFASSEIKRLEEQRLAAIEARVATDLATGRHEDIVAELQQLVAEHPTHQLLTAHLMLALYRSGRQSEALEAYQTLRGVLVELGMEPGRDLCRLHEAVLQQQRSLDLASERDDRHDTRDAGDVRSADGRTTLTDAHKRAADVLNRQGPAAAHGAEATLPQPPMPTFAPRMNDGAFVGRETCLDQLRSHWEKTCVGQTGLVLLMGEAGIGKTRLAARFAVEVHDEGGIVLYGRTDAEALLPYQPFAEALDHLVDHAGAQFAEQLQQALSILSRPFPHLRRHADPAAEALDQDTFRYQIFEAVVTVIAHAGAMRPLLLVLDDLHWADKLTLFLLRHVLRHADGARLLVLGTFRDVEVPREHPLTEMMSNLRRERRYDRLSLDGLDATSTRALVAARLGVEGTERFIHRLQQKTHGNAFFIEETLRALADKQSSMNPVVDDEALGKLGVPDEVADVILLRVRSSALSDEASELLTAASVVGASFRLEIVEQLTNHSSDVVLRALGEGIAAQLILNVPEDVGSYAFSHALVREVLYAQLATEHRAQLLQLHHRVAEALEKLSEREAVNPAELAYHFGLVTHITGPAPARQYSIAAGKRAARVFAYEEAIRHYRRALELFEDDNEVDRCDVLLALGRVQWHAGDDRARETFLIAADSAEHRRSGEAVDSAEHRRAADQLARAALGLGERYFEVTYDTEVGARYRDLLNNALSAVTAQASPRRALLLARLAVNLGFPNEDMGVTDGRKSAQALAADAVAMARELGDDKLLGATLIARHITLLDIRHIDQRLELGEELGSLTDSQQELAAERHHWRMYDLLSVGAIDAAEREHIELVTLAARLGQPLFRSLAEGSRGLWAELAGDIELAEQCAEESLRYAQLAHTRDALSSWASQLFALRRHQGRDGDLAPLVELAPLIERLARSGGHQLGWLSALGVLRFETGDCGEARRIYQEELRGGVRALPRGMFWLTRLALLSELSAMLDDKPGAQAIYAELAPHAARNVVVTYCSFWGPVHGYLALLAETSGDSRLAMHHRDSALAQTSDMQAALQEGRDLVLRPPSALV